MPELGIPDIEIMVSDGRAIPYRGRVGFLVCDQLGGLVNLGMGDSQGMEMQGFNPTISDSWMTAGTDAGQWKTPEGVTFIRFLKDGMFREGASAHTSDDNSELFGAIISPRLAYLDSKIAGTALNTDFTDQNWTAIQGTWQSVKPPGNPQYLRIRPIGTTPTHKAQTAGDIPANRQLRGEVRFVAQGTATAQAAARFSWGGSGDGSLSICWRHGQRITVEKMQSGVWRVLRALDMAPANLAGGRYVFNIQRIAGRLCVLMNGRNFHFVFTETATSGKSTPVDASWPAGKLQFNCFNVRGTLGIGTIKYSEANGNPYTGTFGRIVYKNVDVRPEEENSPPEIKFKGWQRGGTLVEGVPEVQKTYVGYDVTMTASADGIDTPFVSCVMVRFEPRWNVKNAASVDLRPGMMSGSVSLPSLPDTPYSEASFTFDRTILDSQQPTWSSIVDRYMPVTIRARRKYQDGTYYDADWVKLFKGYIYKIDKSDTGVNAHTMTLTMRDASIRLQKPAGIIDHRYPPLDVLFAYKDSSAASPSLWGYDGVAEILLRTLGEDEANALTTYFVNHYPLLDVSGDTGGFLHVQSFISGQPPMTGKFFFPAPYGDDAMTWIGKLAAFDKAVFYYGWPGGVMTNWPVPIYGRIPQIIAAMPTVTIPDAVYVSGDADKLLLQVSTETRPDRDINRVLAWANFQGNNAMADFMPATRMGHDQLQMPDINAVERTWERTMVLSEDFGAVEGGVEALAKGVIMLLGNSEMKWPQFITRGNPSLQWGVKCTFNMVSDMSDANIDLHNETFRCERVQHIFDLGMGSADVWTTSVQARPTSRGIF